MSRTSHRRARPSGRHDQGAQSAGRRARRDTGTARSGRRLRALKAIGVVCGFGFAGIVVLCGVAYAMTEIPPPNETAQSQATVIEWRDGTKMATLGEQKRFAVELSQIPDHLEKAVLAAENRDFYGQPLGVSPTGIARAVWVNLTSDELQGGSTITQQFAQTMYLDTGRALETKFKELFLTLKLEQNMSKDEILEGYLNTIYFGRDGRYGVEAAARSYFGKHVGKLTVAESAFLAAVLNSPGTYDPYQDGKIDKEAKQAAVGRWQYVVNGMVEKGWLSPAKARKLEFPKVRPTRNTGDTYGGTRGYVLRRVEHVLQNEMGFSEKEVFTSGLTIRTTLDRQMQRQAKRSVERTLKEAVQRTGAKKWPYGDVETGLVSVKPKTGEVVAMYGGRNYLKDKVGNVYESIAQLGSSFKPYVLAAALDEGIGLKSTFDGDSPQVIAGQRFENSEDEDYGVVDLVEATQHSVNTAYVHLGLKTGRKQVKDAAVDAGLDKKTIRAKNDSSLFLGSVFLNPVDQAAAMAAFANKGVAVEPHLIRVVRGPKGDVLHKVKPERHRAFSEDVAADVAFAMQQVLTPGGTAADHALERRDAAGKTGTSENNTAAWFVGYTPRLSTAVAMFNPEKVDGEVQVGKLKNIAGYGEIYGSTLPAPIWEAFMEKALAGKPAKPLPKPVFVGEPIHPAQPTPTATPTPSTPTPTETARPTPTSTPTTHTPTPEPTRSIPEPTATATEPPPPGGGGGGGDECDPGGNRPPEDGCPPEGGDPPGDCLFPPCGDQQEGSAQNVRREQ